MKVRKLKKCPYCFENIKFEAIKCKHCLEDLVSSRKIKPSRERTAKDEEKFSSNLNTNKLNMAIVFILMLIFVFLIAWAGNYLIKSANGKTPEEKCLINPSMYYSNTLEGGKCVAFKASTSRPQETVECSKLSGKQVCYIDKSDFGTDLNFSEWLEKNYDQISKDLSSKVFEIKTNGNVKVSGKILVFNEKDKLLDSIKNNPDILNYGENSYIKIILVDSNIAHSIIFNKPKGIRFQAQKNTLNGREIIVISPDPNKEKCDSKNPGVNNCNTSNIEVMKQYINDRLAIFNIANSDFLQTLRYIKNSPEFKIKNENYFVYLNFNTKEKIETSRGIYGFNMSEKQKYENNNRSVFNGKQIKYQECLNKQIENNTNSNTTCSEPKYWEAYEVAIRNGINSLRGQSKYTLDVTCKKIDKSFSDVCNEIFK